MAAFECPEHDHGCGAIWTPDHDKRPRRTAPFGICPDCEASVHRGECKCPRHGEDDDG